MNINPFYDASLPIQIHLVTAVAAFILGSLVLWRRKGNRLHKQMGKVWAGLMTIVIVSSLFINELRTFGPFSAIHLISVGSAIGLIYAIVNIRRGNIEHHRRSMQGLFFGGLVIAGSMAFAPNRVMHRVFFSDGAFSGPSAISPAVLALGSALAVALLVYGWSWLRRNRNRLN